MNLRQLFFSYLLARASRIHEPLIARRKQALFSQVQGRVLEIGPGHGINFQYLPAGIEWTGYEPNPYLARHIPVPRGGKLIPQPFRQERANSFDWAISTLVLCSVPDPAATLAALHHALVPGGKLLYVEHVAAPSGTPLHRAQNRWLPLWRCAADGCHPNRDTAKSIRAAGFDILNEEQFQLPLWLAGPHIAGIARAVK